MALKIPGQKQGKAQDAQPKPAVAVPVIEDWDDDAEALPSLLLLGGSGTGKTDGIAKICRHFNVAVVEIEPKLFELRRYRPKRINLCKRVGERMPTAVERYDRLRRLQDELRNGGYRKMPDGKSVEILAFDGLMEAADLIFQAKRAQFPSRSDSADMWTMVGTECIQLFRDLRDAAGTSSRELGLPPLGIVATCGEGSPKRINMQSGGSYVEKDIPLLPGNMAVTQLPFVFTVIWRLSAGSSIGGDHEFRVHTQAGDTFFAKSPGGIFDPVMTGPGGYDENGEPQDPDVGAMYRRLLSDKRSPYYQEG